MARVVRRRAGAGDSSSRTSDPEGTDSSHLAPDTTEPLPSESETPWPSRAAGSSVSASGSTRSAASLFVLVLVLVEGAHGQRMERAARGGEEVLADGGRDPLVALVTRIDAVGEVPLVDHVAAG